MTPKSRRTLLSIGIATLLGGCYQICPSPDAGQSPLAPAGAAPTEQDAEVAADDGKRLHGEVWTVPRVANDSKGTNPISGSNAPWTAVVYTQSAFVLAEDEPLEGKLTLRISRDGTVSASLPDTAALRRSAASQTIGDERSGYRWFGRFSARGDSPCSAPVSTPERDVDGRDLLGVQFLLARTPKAAGDLAVFGVQVRGNGRDFSHSQIVNSSEKTFSAEFGDSAAAVNIPAPAGLRVFRISITAQPVESHVILPGSEGRLINATFDPNRHILYIVSLGFVLQDDRGLTPAPRTGALRVDVSAP